MASGERITVTYSRPKEGGEALKMDVYAFVPPVDPIDPAPTFSLQNRLPFILFLHGGSFLSGSRRDVPPWLASLARDNGMPLIAPDYRLAPHAGPSHAFADVQAAWQYIVHDLNWIIACSGNGAEVESGNEMLEEDFDELQRRGGIDPDRGIIVGVGSGGYLAALTAALSSPPPLALVLGYPMLEFGKHSPTSQGYFVSANTPGHLRPLLNPEEVGRIQGAKSSIPDMPMVLDKAPYAMDMRSRCGMDAGERWPGKEESIRRQGVTEYLLKEDRLFAMLRKASSDFITPQELLLGGSSEIKTADQQQTVNRPYPPTLVFHGLNDSRIPPESSKRFIDVIRSAEPVAAAMDALASGESLTGSFSSSTRGASTSATKSAHSSSATTGLNGKDTMQPQDDDDAIAFRTVPREPNVTSRYLFLGIDGAQAEHAFDALLPRELRQAPFSRISPKIIGDRYKAGMVHVERFIRHWLYEGSAQRAAAQQKQAKVDDGNDNSNDDNHGGGRIRLPVRGPRL